MEKHVMTILGPTTGDEKVEWDPGDDAAIKTAREKFNEAVKKGLRAFKVEKKEVPGEQITEFDPSLGAILLVPAMAGG